MMVLIRFWRSLTKRNSGVLDMIYNIFFYFNSSFGTFFFTDPDPDFSGSDPDFFWPTRIQTPKTKFDPDSDHCWWLHSKGGYLVATVCEDIW